MGGAPGHAAGMGALGEQREVEERFVKREPSRPETICEVERATRQMSDGKRRGEEVARKR